MIKAIAGLAGLATLAASGPALAQEEPGAPPLRIVIASPADAEELTEELAVARAIMDIMSPPAEREQTVRQLIGEFAGQVTAGLGEVVVEDAGLKAIIDEFRDKMLDEVSATAQVHLPKIIDATAVAYTREFSLDELRETHAFAMTPTGRHYLSRAATLVADPAVAAANTAYFRDLGAVAGPLQEDLRQEVMAYLQNHPTLMSGVTRRNGES